MSRRHAAQKREVIPDPKFNDLVVTKFMNAVMEHGKKSVAERMVYGAFEKMEQKGKANPIDLFQSGARQRHAVGRGSFSSRRRRHVSGAGRSSATSVVRRSPFAG